MPDANRPPKPGTELQQRRTDPPCGAKFEGMSSGLPQSHRPSLSYATRNERIVCRRSFSTLVHSGSVNVQRNCSPQPASRILIASSPDRLTGASAQPRGRPDPLGQDSHNSSASQNSSGSDTTVPPCWVAMASAVVLGLVLAKTRGGGGLCQGKLDADRRMRRW
jgi:hypothetical protein